MKTARRVTGAAGFLDRLFCRAIWQPHTGEETMKIETLRDLKTVLRQGEFTGLGGYPLYLIAADGEALSFAAVRERFREVCADMLDMSHLNQWRIVGVAINYEDADLCCAHTGKPIPSAYADA
jgi:hypothetical protein